MALLLLAATHAARAQLAAPAAGDAAYLDQAGGHAPHVRPRAWRRRACRSTSARCRTRACATAGDPVLFVHGVRKGGFLYLEYWEYLPDSRTARHRHRGLDGSHADDWEGLIVKLRADGVVVGARASAHLGWTGRHPWWDLAKDDWAPYPATVYRAAGSHAGSFKPAGVDLAGDAGTATAGSAAPRLLPADQARRGPARAFDPGATAPGTSRSGPTPRRSPPAGRRSARSSPATPAGGPRLCLICPGR